MAQDQSRVESEVEFVCAKRRGQDRKCHLSGLHLNLNPAPRECPLFWPEGERVDSVYSRREGEEEKIEILAGTTSPVGTP